MASMVVTRLPAAAEIGVMHERTALPSSWIVQAPQIAGPQPNLVPVMPSTSRRTQSNGVSSSTSTVRGLPLTVIVWDICLLMSLVLNGYSKFHASADSYPSTLHFSI